VNRASNCAAVAFVFLAWGGGAALADDPLATLQGMYEGVRIHAIGERQLYIFGAPMTAGLTERAAADSFLSEHGAAFGVQSLDAELLWESDERHERMRVFAYRQQVRGKEVDGSIIRVKVRREAVPRVDYAAARLAGEPTAGAEHPIVPAALATMLVQAQPGYGTLVPAGEPELVVLRGNRHRPDTWCWRVPTETPNETLREPRTFFVDTATGGIAYVRNEFFGLMTDTTSGTVEAPGMPTAYPWTPYTGDPGDLVTHRIPGIRVKGTTSGGSAHTFTDGNGQFVLSHGSLNDPMTLEASASLQGEWYWMSDFSGLYIQDSVATTVGSTESLSLVNSFQSVEYKTAQADVIVSSHRAREFFIDYVSSTATGLTYPVYLYPNYTGETCNAYAYAGPGYWMMLFTPSNSIATKPCFNFGSHSAVGHEYGHIALAMVDSAFAAFPSFHEGYADTYGNMLNDDSVQARGHYMNGDSVRDDPTASHINCQYPIPSNTTTACYCDEYAPHAAGQLLSGPWVRIRNSFKSYYGSSTGLETARDAFGAWSLVTIGGDDDCGSAHGGTLIEVISVVDESLPTQTMVCNAFAQHSITCLSCCP
jgi:hypothetical protein